MGESSCLCFVHQQTPGYKTLEYPSLSFVAPSLIHLHQQHSNNTTPHITMSKSQVFFDVTAGGQPLGRIVMELRGDVVPNVSFRGFSLPRHQRKLAISFRIGS